MVWSLHNTVKTFVRLFGCKQRILLHPDVQGGGQVDGPGQVVRVLSEVFGGFRCGGGDELPVGLRVPFVYEAALF